MGAGSQQSSLCHRYLASPDRTRIGPGDRHPRCRLVAHPKSVTTRLKIWHPSGCRTIHFLPRRSPEWTSRWRSWTSSTCFRPVTPNRERHLSEVGSLAPGGPTPPGAATSPAGTREVAGYRALRRRSRLAHGWPGSGARSPQARATWKRHSEWHRHRPEPVCPRTSHDSGRPFKLEGEDSNIRSLRSGGSPPAVCGSP
jgi:hypothetical protein